MAKKRGKKARKGKKGRKVPKAPKAPKAAKSRKERKIKAVRKKVTAKVAIKALPVIAEVEKRPSKKRREKKEKKKKEKESPVARARIAYKSYFVIWLVAVIAAVFSILEMEYLYVAIAFCIMFFCSFTTAVVHRNLKNKEMVAAIKNLLKKNGKKYETNFDRLLELLKRYKRLKISHISKGFGVSKEKVIEWSEILESHNFLKVRYPPFGEAELIVKGEGVEKRKK